MALAHQKLPTNWSEREALREKGQFWTPNWIASAMIAYVLQSGSDHIFDPAVGAGAFFQATVQYSREKGRSVRLLGCEIDSDALGQALESGLSQEELAGVAMRDFVLDPPDAKYEAVVANPPYIRHHRLSLDVKEKLKALSLRLLGKTIDGRAGLHIYFLIRALDMLAQNGRLAFIMPADTCEGVFAHTLWQWIARHYQLDAVVAFAPDASPFPGVDTNPLIFMIRNAPPTGQTWWARCLTWNTYALVDWVNSDFSTHDRSAISVLDRDTAEGVATGLSRPPLTLVHTGPALGDYAHIMRGIATGDNDFFFLTTRRAQEIGIPARFLIPAVGRTRDVQSDTLTSETLEELDSLDRPTHLLSINGTPFPELPQSVKEYIAHGESLGLPAKALISTRRPWYRMESRPVPPLLFAYLGRRNARFIRNLANAVPLTGFLCVYPYSDEPDFVDRLYQVLQHPETIANLSLVGKSYGSGAVKVEPRSLERLPLPTSIVEAVGLSEYALDSQPRLVMERRRTYRSKPEE